MILSSKQTTYVGLIFGAYLVAHFVPLGTLIGAPLSAVMTGFFEPQLKFKRVVVILFVLLALNTIENPSSLVVAYSFATSYLEMVSNEYPEFVFSPVIPLLFASTEVIVGYFASYRLARIIIKKTGIQKRVVVVC